jgi:aspartate racemase
MSHIGVLGGMGPAATVDFMAKLVALTPAQRDQDHLPVVVTSLPQIPDRSAAIMGTGANPLDALLRGIRLLNQSGAGLIVIPCNTSHHWYEEMQAASNAPILHIAQACVQKITPGTRTLLLATRGALRSGFYQRALDAAGAQWELPGEGPEQAAVDECIRLVKAGQIKASGNQLAMALRASAERGTQAVILGCTELPLALPHSGTQGLQPLDSTLELARAAVDYALSSNWRWDLSA